MKLHLTLGKSLRSDVQLPEGRKLDRVLHPVINISKLMQVLHPFQVFEC